MSTHKPWYDHYEKAVSHTVNVPEKLLYRLAEDAAQSHPQHTALEFLGYTLTYAQLWDSIERFASALQARGLQQGSRVAIMLPNCPQQVIAFFGSSLAGAVIVNTSPLYVARELEEQLKDSGAETLVILNLFLPRYLEIQHRVPVKHVIVTSIDEALTFPKNLLYPLKEKLAKRWVQAQPNQTIQLWKDALKTPKNVHPSRASIHDVAVLQYTGGTTGTPKGAMLSHYNLQANMEQCKAWITDLAVGKEVFLGAIPFFHVYGMTTILALGVAVAGKIVLIPNPRDIPSILKAISGQKPTIFPGVPTLYTAINNHPKTPSHDLTSIRACLSASAPLPLETERKFKEITNGANLVEGYGLTESSPVTHGNPIFGEHVEGSIGLPFPSVDAKVVNDHGEEVPDGEVGELILSGPNIMMGYWNKPEESQKTLKTYAGTVWLHTGDLATRDAKGYFRIVDRKKDLIISSGFNVYPREVEEVLYAHDAVLEAAAVGVPDEYRGEAVKAFVVLKEGKHASSEELQAYCKSQLSPYKVPREFEFRAELPKTAAGKILRRGLVSQGEGKA